MTEIKFFLIIHEIVIPTEYLLGRELNNEPKFTTFYCLRIGQMTSEQGP